MPVDERIFHVGDIQIQRVTEAVFTDFAPDFLLPQWNSDDVADELEWLVPGSLAPGHASLVVSIHSWIVRTPDKLIVIDTGIGNGRQRRIGLFNNLDTPFLANLAAAGVDPEEVDHVLCTHVHSDHVGWNTRWSGERWTPTFPKARYHCSEVERAISVSPAFRDSLAAGVYEDSVLPVEEAGLLDLVGPNGGEILEGIFFHPTPGHTAGHMSISVHSKGETAFFSGDVVHNAIQIRFPQWNSAFCEMQEPARASRRWALDYAADRQALFLPAHFRESSAGYVTRRDDGFIWAFA